VVKDLQHKGYSQSGLAIASRLFGVKLSLWRSGVKLYF